MVIPQIKIQADYEIDRDTVAVRIENNRCLIIGELRISLNHLTNKEIHDLLSQTIGSSIATYLIEQRAIINE